MAEETSSIHRRRLGNKTENLDGQICRGMPLCSDHNFLQSGSMVPLCSWAQLCRPGNLSPHCTAPHLQNTQTSAHTGHLFILGFSLGTANRTLPDHQKTNLYYLSFYFNLFLVSIFLALHKWLFLSVLHVECFFFALCLDTFCVLCYFLKYYNCYWFTNVTYVNRPLLGFSLLSIVNPRIYRDVNQFKSDSRTRAEHFIARLPKWVYIQLTGP